MRRARRASERELVGGLRDALRASTTNHPNIYDFLLEHTVRNVSLAALEEEDSQKVAIISNVTADEVMLGGSSCLCSICIDEDNRVALGDEVTMLLCKHWYHSGCINEWLQIMRNCPICRLRV